MRDYRDSKVVLQKADEHSWRSGGWEIERLNEQKGNWRGKKRGRPLHGYVSQFSTRELTSD